MSRNMIQKFVTTRKDHYCWGCTFRIKKGTKEVYFANGLDCDGFYSMWICPICKEIDWIYGVTDCIDSSEFVEFGFIINELYYIIDESEYDFIMEAYYKK